MIDMTVIMTAGMIMIMRMTIMTDPETAGGAAAEVSIGSLSVCPMPGGKEADRLPLPPPSKKVEGPCTGSPRLLSGTCR